MAQRLIRFRANPGSGHYRAQLVNCETGAVLSSGGYVFDKIFSGQPTSGLVELRFEGIPVGTLLPAGYQLKVSDVDVPGVLVLGRVLDSSLRRLPASRRLHHYGPDPQCQFGLHIRSQVYAYLRVYRRRPR